MYPALFVKIFLDFMEFQSLQIVKRVDCKIPQIQVV